ncbi:hypothetical protein OIV83_003923 [Microbotryomycetes sp. JL201]|nr:hypothetical protein OIV83_003923 [Microbotryomycetes sp. JL201]
MQPAKRRRESDEGDESVAELLSGNSVDVEEAQSGKYERQSDDDDESDKLSSPIAAAADDGDTVKGTDVGAEDGSAAVGVHQGQGGWTAVWDPAHNAYYFFNSITNETTWTNPLEANGERSASTVKDQDELAVVSDVKNDPLGGIDPDLAFLDPNLQRRELGSGGIVQGRFNARTGRFQADATANPDRVSEYNRGVRQQQAFYNVDSWTEGLQGRGLRLRDSDAESEATNRKKPSSKEVQAFKQRKEAKKRAKLLASMK